MNKRKFTLKHIVSDTVAAFIAWILFMMFRKFVNDGLIFGMWFFVPNYSLITSLYMFPLACLFVHYLSGFYLQPEKQTAGTIISTTLITSGVIALVMFFALLLDDMVVSYEYYYYSLLVLFFLLFSVTVILRLIIHNEIVRNFKNGKWSPNTVIIGNGKNAVIIANELKRKSSRNTVCGFVSTGGTSEVEKNEVLGTFQQIQSIIENHNVKEVIIALDQPDEKQLLHYINALYKYNVEIRFTPRLYEILTGSAQLSTAGLAPLVSITQINMSDWQISVKRFFDIVASAIALIILSPIFIFFAIRIKSDSKGSVFYRQERIGRHGKPFNIVKFRTMYENAETNVPKLSSPDDERITPVGRVLRKYRIDELPQFWNVLMGEMSIVGPRPERRFYINQILEQAPYYCLLYKIRPGLTSWGPIKIGYSDSVEKMIDRLNYDIIYLENMSLLNDFRILLLTLEIIFRGKGV